jgi:hypothetical protein
MKQLRTICLTVFLSPAVLAVAASVPKAVVPDNVILCQANAGCYNKTLLGRSYRVLSTPRFTVMVSVSVEAGYTRADVSISNNTGMPIAVDPEDFRIEVLSPKPGVLAYIAPGDLKTVPASPAVPPLPPEHVVETVSSTPRMLTASTEQTSNIDELYAAAKKREALREAYDKAVAQQHLAASSVASNEVIRGRVYFERDKHAQMTNIVLPVAGMVFEFPYQMK